MLGAGASFVLPAPLSFRWRLLRFDCSLRGYRAALGDRGKHRGGGWAPMDRWRRSRRPKWENARERLAGVIPWYSLLDPMVELPAGGIVTDLVVN